MKHSTGQGNKQQIIRLIAIAAMGLTSIGLGARPSWHFIKREVARERAKTVWSDWKAGGEQARREGEPAFWLRVPAASVNTLVVRGANAESLRRYPGIDRYLGRETKAVPVVLAHRDTHFRKLHRAAIGDSVWVENTSGNRNHLIIRNRKITSMETAEIVAAQLAWECDDNSIIMITCYPAHYTGPAPERLLILATET